MTVTEAIREARRRSPQGSVSVSTAHHNRHPFCWAFLDGRHFGAKTWEEVFQKHDKFLAQKALR